MRWTRLRAQPRRQWRKKRVNFVKEARNDRSRRASLHSGRPYKCHSFRHQRAGTFLIPPLRKIRLLRKRSSDHPYD